MKYKKSGRRVPLKTRLRQILPFCWGDFAVCAGILAAAMLLCYLLRMIDDSDVFVALIFELAVVLVSRFTNGYLFGLLASVLGVVVRRRSIWSMGRYRVCRQDTSVSRVWCSRPCR